MPGYRECVDRSDDEWHTQRLLLVMGLAFSRHWRFTPHCAVILRYLQVDATFGRPSVECGSTGQTGKRQKVVVLRELQRAIIYTTR